MGYTQEDFDNFEIVNGRKICPSGDYSGIKTFGEWCSFGERCSFGEMCYFEEWCSLEGGLTNCTYFACDRIGSEKRKTYFYKSDKGYHVRAGCFFGTFDEFENEVKKVHSNTKHEQEYLSALELAKIVLG